MKASNDLKPASALVTNDVIVWAPQQFSRVLDAAMDSGLIFIRHQRVDAGGAAWGRGLFFNFRGDEPIAVLKQG